MTKNKRRRNEPYSPAEAHAKMRGLAAAAKRIAREERQPKLDKKSKQLILPLANKIQ